MAIQRFKLEGKGLDRVLGALEARIMEALWQSGNLTVREMTAILGSDVHYKTILTVANRMVDKGLLAREPAGDRAFRYRAMETKEAFLDRVSMSITLGIVGEFGRRTLAHFVEAASEVDTAYLDELARLVEQKRAEAS